MSVNYCLNDWRVEALDLATGKRRTWLRPTSVSFDQLLNEVGNGSVSVPVRSVTSRDLWPHLTSVAISRITGLNATPENPVCEYIGIVEDLRTSSNGDATVGLKSIEQYLQYRLIHGDQTFTGEDQNQIGADLVNLASSGGIPLVGTIEESTITRDRTYLDTDRKQILEAILQLTQVINGPDYELVHQYADDAWGTTMNFSDYRGNTEPYPLNTRLGVSEYDTSVSAEDHANVVVGVGEDPAMSYTEDRTDESIYPTFEKSVSWSDVSVPATLQEHTEGEAQNNVHPSAVPAITVVGTDRASGFSLGDTIDLTIDHGAIQYHGLARVVGKTWSVSEGEPTTATLSLTPLDDAGQAILGGTV